MILTSSSASPHLILITFIGPILKHDKLLLRCGKFEMPTGVYKRHARPLKDRLLDLCIPEPNSGCWIFMGCLHQLGYGRIAKKKNEHEYAHRAAFEVFRGRIPKGMHVLHTCDVPCCVNPDHLWLGTHKDNMHDMIRKGRSNFGGYGPVNPIPG
ncbi:MAG: HNH endonuclease signature motif containing protein [Tardiphaga sp.]